MDEVTLNSRAEEKKVNPTVQFAIAALISVFLSVVMMTTIAAYLLRSVGIEMQFEKISYAFDRDLKRQVNFANFKTPDLNGTRQILAVKRLHDIEEMAFFGLDGRLLWSSTPGIELGPLESQEFESFVSGELVSPVLVDPLGINLSMFNALLSDKHNTISALTPIFSAQDKLIALVKTRHNFDPAVRVAKSRTGYLFFVILAGHLLLVYVLYNNFRRGIKIIEKQEDKLSQQITRLSNMLTLNKSMQHNIKSASSRAVELNEQFLRRVGADLHDGPAQSIGYAVLRLDQVSRTLESKELGQEFHAVKEALDGALTEIRGISTGLVLPELDDLTLEQSLQRVVTRHAVNSDIEVKQFYTDLPEQIATPVKICAYRFVQEGLNNASRHGQAEKARVTAQVKDDVLHLSLKDNGMGFRKSKLNAGGKHLGLMGLKDRIESLGGTFSINSELGVGTAIKVTMALDSDG
ncbi:MAG: sensor histidine kinase [bacterium]